jgi:hypothetical protein
MLHAWNEGMASVRSGRKDNKLKGLTAYIKAAGFSDPTPPERPTIIGRSELLGRSGSQKSKSHRPTAPPGTPTKSTKKNRPGF